MSRIGLRPIPVPAGVTVSVDEATNVVTVKGPKGTLTQDISRLLTLSQADGNLTLERPNNLREARSQHGLAHKHVGSLHATDAEMAINHARDVYTRRNEGLSIWVVRAADIVASSPSDKDPLFEPANSKVYRHPTFFPMPDEIKHM